MEFKKKNSCTFSRIEYYILVFGCYSLEAFAKFSKKRMKDSLSASVRLSLSLSLSLSVRSHWRDFHENWYSGAFHENWYSGAFNENWYSGAFRENWYSGAFRKSVENIQGSLKFDKKNDKYYQYAFLS
jgi:hypothetical protein